MVSSTGFIPLPHLTIVSMMWESSQWLGMNIERSTGKRDSKKAWEGARAQAAMIYLK